MIWQDKIRAKMTKEQLAKVNRLPARKWPTRWIFTDHSDQDFEYQVIDILTDIRNILLITFLVWLIF